MKNFLLLAWAIILLPIIGFSQDKPLKGKVVDDSTGQGLPNVSVALVGSNRGTNTDGNGIFSLRVPSGAKTQLRFSSVGYSTFTIIVTDGINGDIRLKKEDKTLEDVVVIGYGTQKQRNLTGSVSTFDTKSIQEKPIARIDQAMIGQMAGVQVKQQTGLPGQGGL